MTRQYKQHPYVNLIHEAASRFGVEVVSIDHRGKRNGSCVTLGHGDRKEWFVYYPNEAWGEVADRLESWARKLVNDATPHSVSPDPANPKDALGSKKVSLTKFPAVALAHAAHAMMDGAQKYGAYNWREKKVRSGIYVDACMRHLLSWNEGQEFAKDSGAHHLGHAIACLGILLDAQESGNLIDERPIYGNPDMMDEVLGRLSEKIKQGGAHETQDQNPRAVVDRRDETLEEAVG